MVCALLGLDCTIYMGATDVVRQAPPGQPTGRMGAAGGREMTRWYSRTIVGKGCGPAAVPSR